MKEKGFYLYEKGIQIGVHWGKGFAIGDDKNRLTRLERGKRNSSAEGEELELGGRKVCGKS